MRTRVRTMGLVTLSLFMAGCAHTKEFSASKSAKKRTCLVLSVGGPPGIAHLGAVEAVKESGMKVDCVVGNSMGSLVGGLYASAPNEDTTLRFKKFAAAYVAATKGDAAGLGLVAALVAGGLIVATGGAALPAVAAGLAAGAAGAASVDKVSLSRTAEVIATQTGNPDIRSLPVDFVTFHHKVTDGGAELVTVTDGPLAVAIEKSIANPLVFKRFDATKAGFVDPGVDRMSAVPIEDTCRLFPDAQILAINTSGEPATYDSKLKCPVLEVQIEVDDVSPEEIMLPGDGFDRAVTTGYTVTARAIARSR